MTRLSNVYNSVLEFQLINGAMGSALRDSLFPSASLLAAKITADELDQALQYYLRDNPLFGSYQIKESSIDLFHELTHGHIYQRMYEFYPELTSDFAVELIQLKENSAILCYFPIQLIDGYTCFKFHLALAHSVADKQDHFRNREVSAQYGIKTQFELPEIRRDENVPIPKVPKYSGIYRLNPDKTTVYELAMQQARKIWGRDEGKFIQVRNVAYDVPVTFGNFLITPIVPCLADDRPLDIKTKLDAQFDYLIAGIKDLNSTELKEFLQAYVKQNGSREVFFVNNFGSVNNEPVLLNYIWGLPLTFMRYSCGANLVVTLNRRFTNCWNLVLKGYFDG